MKLKRIYMNISILAKQYVIRENTFSFKPFEYTLNFRFNWIYLTNQMLFVLISKIFAFVYWSFENRKVKILYLGLKRFRKHLRKLFVSLIIKT